jgi:hypothetical protein
MPSSGVHRACPGPGTLGQPAQRGKGGQQGPRGLPPPGAVVHARGVYDRGSARRRGNVARDWPRGSRLAAAVGTSFFALAGPALAGVDALQEPSIAAAEPETSAAARPEPEPEATAATGPEASEPGTEAARPEREPEATEATKPETSEPDTTEAAPPVEPEPKATAEAPRPPRIDGAYIGGTVFTGVNLVRLNTFDTDGPFAAFGGTASFGQMVFPWLGLGLHGGGGAGVRSQQGARQRLGQGYLGVQFKFVPLSKRQVPLSLLASFGFGGGAVRQAGILSRAGFGGAQFGAAVRYELFPWAKRRRPFRGGGFGLGPELGWIGFTPAAAGRPMSNVIYLALSTTFYFGS